jgi:hypothetical protein
MRKLIIIALVLLAGLSTAQPNRVQLVQLSTTGASSGNVVTFNGTAAVWAAPSGGGGGASLSTANVWTAQQTFTDATLTDKIVLSSSSGDAFGTITSPASSYAGFGFLEGSARRWMVARDPSADFSVLRYNSSGVFQDVPFSINDANGNVSLTGQLLLSGTNTNVQLKGITNEPSAPPADTLTLYSKKIAGRMVAKLKGPSGLDTPLQSALWGNNAVLWSPTTATAGLWIGTAGAGAGTYSTQLPTTASQYQSIKRARWANVVTTLNQVLGQRNTEAMFFRGSTTGQGGFFFFARGGADIWTNGSRFFAGFATATTVVSAEPSALNNTIGFAVDSRGTAATKASTGFTLASNTGFDFYIFAPPASSEIHWRIVALNTLTEASGTATANLPGATTMLTANFLASNAALTPVNSTQIGLNRMYVETDY